MDAITELRRQRTKPPTLTWKGVWGMPGNKWYHLLTVLLFCYCVDKDEAIEDFQRKVGIEVDGICGPQTWSYLAKRDDSPGERTVQVALKEAYSGAREIGGNNRGKWTDKYFDSVKMGIFNTYWCVAYAMYCYQSQHSRTVPKYPWILTGDFRDRLRSPRLSSSALVKWGQENYYNWGRPYAAHTQECVKPGDTFVVVKGGRTGYKHTALLLDVDGDDIWVIEGNVRPRKWMAWQRDIVRVGKYKASQVVFVQPEE